MFGKTTFFVAIAVLVAVADTWAAGVSYSEAVLADNPIGYWRLGETSGSNALDASGSDLHGSYRGVVTLGQQAGVVTDSDTSALFDGSTAHVDVGHRSILNGLTNDFTVEAWVKGTGPIVSTRYFAGGVHQRGFQFQVMSERLTFTTFGFKDHTLAYSFPSHRWTHVAVAFHSSNDASFYVDGDYEGTVYGSQPATTSSGRLNIGRHPVPHPITGAQHHFTGSIDEVAIYGTALTAEKIQAHYLAAVPEPSCLFLLGIGGVSLLALAWRRKRRAAAFLIAGVIVVVGANPTFADIISWHASSGVLPDDPSIPAASRFNVAGERSYLSMENGFMNVDDPGPSYVMIRKDDMGTIPDPEAWTWQVELRMNDHSRPTLDWGAEVGIATSERWAMILVAKNAIGFTADNGNGFVNGISYAMDTTDDFHTYRFARESGLASLYVDASASAVLSVPYDALRLRPTSTGSHVRMLDSESIAVSNFDVRSFAYNLNGTAVPEPNTTVLLLCAAITLLVFARRKRSLPRKRLDTFRLAMIGAVMACSLGITTTVRGQRGAKSGAAACREFSRRLARNEKSPCIQGLPAIS